MDKRNDAAGRQKKSRDQGLDVDDMVPAAGKHAARPSEADRLEALDEPPAADPRQAAEEKIPTADEPVPGAPDPGGAHSKGYSADPRPEEAVEDEGPIPLADGPDKHPAYRVPERDDKVRPTGRSEPKEYSPNDRLMGSDR